MSAMIIEHQRLEDNSVLSNINNKHYLVLDCKSSLRQGNKNQMLFKEFIQQNIGELELPFEPTKKRKYPPKVWTDLHKTMLVSQLQNYRRKDTVKSLIDSINGGDDLGGLTMENVIDMWLESMISVIGQIIGSALGNSKIKKLYKELVTERQVECSSAHNEVEEHLVEQGVELPEHIHTVESIGVDDENREQFDRFVNLVLQNFDSDTYGELPTEYSKARESDIEAMVTELKDLIGDDQTLASSLKSSYDGVESGDFV